MRFVAVVIAMLAGLSAPAAAAPPSLAAISARLGAVTSFSAVAISRTGRLAYVERRRGRGRVYVATIAAPRRVRALAACDGCDDDQIAFSPDGDRLAFVRTGAGGQAQIAVADLRAGTTVVVTRLRGPLATPRWSPDGTRLAFLYTPGAEHVPSPLLPAPQPSGVIRGASSEQRLAIVGAHGGAVRLLGPSTLNVYEFDWSPDGRRFAVTAAYGNGDANWWVARLWTIDAASGTARAIHKPALQIASPRWSPDGRTIAYIGGIMSDESITGGDVFVVPAAGGGAIDVTPGMRASAYAIAWTAPGRILANELAGGMTRLAAVDVGARAQRVLWAGAQLITANAFFGIPGDAGIARGPGAITAVVRQSPMRAPEVALGPIGDWHDVTAVNARVRPPYGAARSITWTSGPFRVQGWVLLPRGYDPHKRYPSITIPHGGPAFAYYPWFPQRLGTDEATLAARGYVVFLPNPRGSYGEGEAFTRANVRDFGYGDLRDILAGLDAVEHRFAADPHREGITGHSYGGYMTMWAVTQTRRFRAAVASAGLADWLSYYGTNDIDTWMIPYFGASVYADPAVYARSAPMTFITRVRTPTLVLGGDRDAECPITQSWEFWHALHDLGVPTELVVYHGEGHLFTKPADALDASRRTVDWFDRHL